MRDKRWLGAIALLTCAGFLGNYFSLSLLFGVDFLFGSIAILIIAYYFGWGWGGLAGLIAGSCTYFLWHHPYATIILVIEALFVGFLCKRKNYLQEVQTSQPPFIRWDLLVLNWNAPRLAFLRSNDAHGGDSAHPRYLQTSSQRHF